MPIPPEAYMAGADAIKHLSNWIQIAGIVIMGVVAIVIAYMTKLAKDSKALAVKNQEVVEANKKVIDAETEIRKKERDAQLSEMVSKANEKFAEIQSKFNDRVTETKHIAERTAEALAKHIEDDRERDKKTDIYIEKIDNALNILKDNFHRVDVKLEKMNMAMETIHKEIKREHNN